MALHTNNFANPAASPHRSTVSFLLYLYVILLPFQLPIGERFNFAPSDAALLAYILFHSGSLRLRKGAWSIWHMALLPMMIFSAWIGVQHIGELTQYVLVNKLLGALWLLIGYSALCAAMTSNAVIRSLARAFVASVSLVNIVAIAGFFWTPLEKFMPQLNYYSGVRLAGFLIDPNAFGGLLLTAFTLQTITRLWKAPLYCGVLGLFCSVSTVVGLVLTFSRSAWIGLGGALIFLAVVRPMKSAKMAILIAISGLLPLLYSVYKSLEYFYVMAIRPGTIQSRLDAEGAALNGFLLHPFVGTGLGTFLYEHGAIIHDSYLWVLSECGILGAVVIFGLTMWYFKVAIPVIRSTRGASQGLIIALAAAHAGMIGVSVGIEVLYQRYWWLIMAMIVACQPSPVRKRLIRVWFNSPPDPGYGLSSPILVRIDAATFRKRSGPLRNEQPSAS